MTRPDSLSTRPSFRRSKVLPWLCAAGALVASAASHAQSSPYSLRLAQRFGVDNNIFRVSSGEQRDYYSLTSVTLGLDQPISRQRLYASATADYTAWKGNDQLNGPGYDLLGGVAWEIGSRLTGDVHVQFRQAQANPADYGTLSSVVSQKNKERSGVFDFRGAYGGIGLLAIEGVYNHTDIQYSNDAFATRERKSDTVGAGLRVRQTPDLSYGVMYRYTSGEYPRGVALVGGGFLKDEYDRRDIDLSAALRVSDLTAFTGRISYTKEDHDAIAARSFSGVTGELAALYRPTGKVELGASLSRDTGSGGQQSQLTTTGSSSGTTTGTGTTGTSAGTGSTAGTVGAITGGTGLTGGSSTNGTTGYLSDARVTDRLRLTAQWDATAKVRFTTAVAYARERYDTVFVTGTTGTVGQAKGKTRGVSLGALYQFSRTVSFECGAAYESRDTGAGAGVVGDYDATTGYCGAALLLN